MDSKHTGKGPSFFQKQTGYGSNDSVPTYIAAPPPQKIIKKTPAEKQLAKKEAELETAKKTIRNDEKIAVQDVPIIIETIEKTAEATAHIKTFMSDEERDFYLQEYWTEQLTIHEKKFAELLAKYPHLGDLSKPIKDLTIEIMKLKQKIEQEKPPCLIM